jgi:hypothetical protein
MDSTSFWTLMIIIGVCVVVGLASMSSLYEGESPVYEVEVDRKEVMYSTGTDGDRFYRIFSKEGNVFDIRDFWPWDRSGSLYGKIKEGQTCQIVVKSTFLLHCWKYPCIKKVSCSWPQRK